MKKIIALLLCLALLGCCAAVAETAGEKETIGTLSVNGAFIIKCRMMEGYKISIISSTGDTIVALVSGDSEDKPVITMSIVFNDTYTTEDGQTLRLNDVSEEDMELIRESFTENSEVEEFRELETAFGTKVLMVRGKIGAQNYVDFYSVYNSYEIELVAHAGQGAEDKVLTDEQIQTVIDFLSDMDFEAVE